MKRPLIAAVLVFVSGCGQTPRSDPVIPLAQVPEQIRARAEKELPGYTFFVVYQMKEDGKTVYELRGKNQQGKVREVEISESGEILEVE